jgi:hypothetical protein
MLTGALGPSVPGILQDSIFYIRPNWKLLYSPSFCSLHRQTEG